VRSARLPLLLAVAVAIAFSIAYLANASYFEELRFLRNLPRASLASPIEGPALYRGRLFGPSTRMGPSTKKPAAMTWWWVYVGGSKSRKKVCFESAIGEVTLQDGGKSAPLTAIRGNISLLSEARNADWEQRTVVDTGTLAEHTSSKLPLHATKCEGSNPAYTEVLIPEGAEVEVVGCYSGGALRECGQSPLSAVLAVPDLLTHRIRRADISYRGFIVVAGISIAVVGLLFVLGLVGYRRTSKPMRPA
jgi:hypothetical protein